MNLTPHLADKTHVIWDWNGTLLDDVTLCVDIIIGMLATHRLPAISFDDYKKRFRFPVINYYRDLGFDFDRTPFASLSDEFMQLYREQVGACELFAGRSEMLTSLRQAGIRHAVLSATKETYLHTVLARYGVDHHFEHAFGIADDLAHSKVDRGHQLIAKLGVAPDKLLLVGDTDHDLEVGKALGIDVVLVGDGHQCPDYLRTKHPHVLTSVANQV